MFILNSLLICQPPSFLGKVGNRSTYIQIGMLNNYVLHPLGLVNKHPDTHPHHTHAYTRWRKITRKIYLTKNYFQQVQIRDNRPFRRIYKTAEERDTKSKEERERYIQLNAEFQRKTRDKAFFNEQCIKIEKNNRW